MPSFKSIRDYVYDRRRGLATALGLAGGIYLLGQYVGGRLEEIRDKVIQDRAAREK
jgi:peroxin-3